MNIASLDEIESGRMKKWLGEEKKQIEGGKILSGLALMSNEQEARSSVLGITRGLKLRQKVDLESSLLKVCENNNEER